MRGERNMIGEVGEGWPDCFEHHLDALAALERLCTKPFRYESVHDCKVSGG